MNSINSINSMTKLTREPPNLVLNEKFANPGAPQNSLAQVQNTTWVTNWTATGLSSFNSAHLFNNLSTASTVAPSNWNTVPIRRALSVTQTRINVIEFRQSINMSAFKPYSVSVWLNHGRLGYVNSQYFGVLIDGVQVIGPINFTTGSTTTNWAKYEGTYTPNTVGRKTLTLQWLCYVNNVQTNIMVTEVVVK